MSEKNVEVEEDKDSSVDEFSSDREKHTRSEGVPDDVKGTSAVSKEYLAPILKFVDSSEKVSTQKFDEYVDDAVVGEKIRENLIENGLLDTDNDGKVILGEQMKKVEEDVSNIVDDDFVIERVDPSKIKNYIKSEEGKSVLGKIQSENRLNLEKWNLESESDMRELEKRILKYKKFERAIEKRTECMASDKLQLEDHLTDHKFVWESDKTHYMKILAHDCMVQGKINRALEWGKREAEMEVPVLTEDYTTYYHITSPFCPGYGLGEIAQFVKNSEWLLNKIYMTTKEVRHDSGREDNLAAIAGAYALRGDLTTARNIINEDIQYNKEAKDKAKSQLAIALGKSGYIDEAYNIIDNLTNPPGVGCANVKNIAVANLEEEILEEKGPEYLINLFFDLPWASERFGRLIEKLKVKNKDDMARELAFKAANNRKFIDRLAPRLSEDKSKKLDSSEYEEYLKEGKIHEELRNAFLDEGLLIGEKAYLSESQEKCDNFWKITEDKETIYEIRQGDDEVIISPLGRMKITSADFFSWLMSESLATTLMEERYGKDESEKEGGG